MTELQDMPSEVWIARSLEIATQLRDSLSQATAFLDLLDNQISEIRAHIRDREDVGRNLPSLPTVSAPASEESSIHGSAVD